MSAKVCVFLTGLVYVFFGVAGLFPNLVYPPPPRIYYYQMPIVGHWGYLFTWLPVNLPHDCFYIAIGGLGILASPVRATAILYARAIFFLMILLVGIGFLPLGLSNLGGLMPLFDWNIMLHTVTATLLFYFGFIYPLDMGGKEPPNEVLRINT